jgi:hypothetical protein
MATRKQRRRREKSFRHEYGFVMRDDEGTEIELAGSELRAQKDGTSHQKPGSAAAKGKDRGKSNGRQRVTRDPEPATWRKALRRGALWGAPIIAGCIFFLRSLPMPTRIALGVGYALLFIPVTFWMDRAVYRRFERRKDAPTNGKGR